jgi:hypothetical protein
VKKLIVVEVEGLDPLDVDPSEAIGFFEWTD